MWAYGVALAFPAGAALTTVIDRPEWFFLPVVLGVPVLDALIGHERGLRRNELAQALIHYVPHAFVALWFYSIWLAGEKLSTLDGSALLLLLLNCGFVAAVATVHGHELLHRPDKMSRMLASFVFALLGYGHFMVAHLNHHAGTGLQRYGYAPRQGQMFWSYLAVSMANAFTQAVRSNRIMVARQWCLSLLICALLWTRWGEMGLVLFAVQSVFAILLLEVANYIQHYGFVRAPGEPPQKELGWDTDWWLSNRLIINNPCHVAHHRFSGRPFHQLPPIGPYLPYGYFVMLWAALVPPLWFFIMDRHVNQVKAQSAGMP